MTFRKLFYQIHLWLGLITGIIMFIVCITGAIWVFNEEITAWTNPSPKLKKEVSSLLPPSRLVATAEKEMDGEAAGNIQYIKGETAKVTAYGDQYYYTVLLHPGTAEVLKVEKTERGKTSFSRFILKGHRFLWLPWKAGRPIVNYSTMVFVLVLISGLFLWWPQTKKALKSSLWFRWKKETGTKRKLYDLHNILGFYSLFVLLAIALTGMVWGIEWYSNGLYKLTSGGRELPQWQAAESDTLQQNDTDPILAVDRIFKQLVSRKPDAHRLMITLPDKNNPASAINAYVYHDQYTDYNRDNYSFDRYTLQEIPFEDVIYHGKLEDVHGADKLRRMNYDIHVGSILGLPGKILVFFAALIGASLPVTGTWLFILREKRKRKNRKMMSPVR